MGRKADGNGRHNRLMATLDDGHIYDAEQIREQMDRMSDTQFDASWVAMVLDTLAMEYHLVKGLAEIGRCLAFVRQRYRTYQEDLEGQTDRALEVAMDLASRHRIHRAGAGTRCLDCKRKCHGLRCATCHREHRRRVGSDNGHAQAAPSGPATDSRRG